VREGGLEPPHLAAYAPEAYASTNFATPATAFQKRSAKVNSFSFYTTLFSSSFKKISKNSLPGNPLRGIRPVKRRFWRPSKSRSGGFFKRSGMFLKLTGGILKLFFDLKRFRVFAFLKPTFSLFGNI